MKTVRLFDYPQLRYLCWHRQTDMELTEEQAWSIYRRHWRHLNKSHLTDEEAAFIARLEEENFREKSRHLPNSPFSSEP